MSLTMQVISNKAFAVVTDADKSAMKALRDAAEDILRQAQSEVPHETGALMRSGRVEPVGDDSVVIRFTEPYAARQHEVPAKNYTTPGTKWKYLEDPLRRNRDNVMRVVQDGLSVLFRG